MARVQTVAGYPVKQYTSPNRSTDKMSDHRGVVLHIAEGGYAGTINWQMNPDQRYSDGTKVNTCSTWIVGKNEGEIAQMVDSDEIAWCQRSGSRTWLSIELAGFHTEPEVPTAWQRRACAELFLWSHKRYGHPLAIADTDAERGLGHHSMDREPVVEWGHEQCPGRYVIAAKPDILRVAQALNNGEDVDEMQLGDKLSNGVSVDNALMTLLARTDYLANKWSGVVDDQIVAMLTPKLNQILAAANDDAATTVTMSAEDRAALASQLATAVAGPLADAVVDEQAARLQS